jgi:ribosomal protein S12 methylthiotransferase accessory factor YcaO
MLEYNEHYHPDVLGAPGSLLDELEGLGIRYRLKDCRNDLSVPAFGVYLEGEDEGETVHAWSIGTHLSKDVALSRAVTEALQLYPRSANYDDWLASCSLDHLSRTGSSTTNWQDIASRSYDCLLDCILDLIDLLRDRDSEVCFVDLSLPDTPFAVVAVLASRLQPIIVPDSPRFSQRLLDVPVELGWREEPLNPAEIRYRHLCGHGIFPIDDPEA